jgi:AcrR family transcriptional regulator
MAKRTRSDGRQSRERILATAERLATVEGLDGLSLANLADAAGMSKSGVFGLFGSKQELQLATVDRAREIFLQEVVTPARSRPAGVDRLLALCLGYLDYVERRVWPSGCFFASVASEVGPRPGPVRDRIAAGQLEWVALLTDQARRAVEAGRLPPDPEPEQLALELSTLLTGADIAYLLHGHARILERMRRAVRARIDSSTISRTG